MESNSRFKQWAESIRDWLNEQEWFREAKTKWDGLDPQVQSYVKLGTALAVLVLAFVFAGGFIWSVHSAKRELAEKSDLLHMVQNANEEMRQLKATPTAPSAPGEAAWPAYFTTVASGSGIGGESMTVSEEKKGAAQEEFKESLFDVSVKKINIRQVVRFVFQLESGNRPVKVRNLTIDTQPDGSGYLDATLSVSAFTQQAQSR